mgnify:CR=1 FL=1
MTSPFPADFLWGAATSAYQTEGSLDADGRGPSVWDSFVRRPNAIEGGVVAMIEMPPTGPALVVPCELEGEQVDLPAGMLSKFFQKGNGKGADTGAGVEKPDILLAMLRKKGSHKAGNLEGREKLPQIRAFRLVKLPNFFSSGYVDLCEHFCPVG